MPVIETGRRQLPRVRRRGAPTSTMALAIAAQREDSRLSVCNTAESLLVHARRGRRRSWPLVAAGARRGRRDRARRSPDGRPAAPAERWSPARPTTTSAAEYLSARPRRPRVVDVARRRRRPHPALRHRSTPRRSSPVAGAPPGEFAAARRRRRGAWSTRRPGSPTAASSASAPRSASHRRSCTPWARWAARADLHQVHRHRQRPHPLNGNPEDRARQCGRASKSIVERACSGYGCESRHGPQPRSASQLTGRGLAKCGAAASGGVDVEHRSRRRSASAVRWVAEARPASSTTVSSRRRRRPARPQRTTTTIGARVRRAVE